MKLFKILSQVTLDTYFRIVDKTGAVLFEGNINSKSSIPLNLLNAKVAFFRPIIINDDVSDEAVTFASTVIKYNSLKKACLAYMVSIPTEITLKVLRCDLNGEIDII